MDFLDEVINFEENAYKEGEEQGKIRAQEESKKESIKLGGENGYYIGKEYGFIIGYTQIVDLEEHLREKHQKVIRSILATEINEFMPSEEINKKIIFLRSQFKLLLSLIKVKLEYPKSIELF
ncbi:hypothetical protein SteCoe_1318 [Stentor coeruleus]|uniref:Essential protein Yae1 N-terminal domain-containing protein n=1 Tax=Stentor coeruleus TaxID=5963 RepID=A0A1R2D287_9CILI|nr:hypothetical protein SteCoe_1318 [Stentor coeruleus]